MHNNPVAGQNVYLDFSFLAISDEYFRMGM
jgi:hypothetical protein